MATTNMTIITYLYCIYIYNIHVLIYSYGPYKHLVWSTRCKRPGKITITVVTREYLRRGVTEHKGLHYNTHINISYIYIFYVYVQRGTLS